jgi:hypothetical protein
MGPLCPTLIYGSPVPLLQFQMAPKLILLMSSGSKKKEPRYACLSEAKASHSKRMWAEVSSYLLHNGLSDSPIKWRCLLRVLCPVRRPVTALDCVLLKDRNLTLAPRQGPKINSQACLWVSPKTLPPYPMLVNQPESNPSLYILSRPPRPAQVRQTLELSRPLWARRRSHYLVPQHV